MHHNSRRGFLALLGLGAVGPAAAKVADLLPAEPVLGSPSLELEQWAIEALPPANPLFQTGDIVWNGVIVRDWRDEFIREFERNSVFSSYMS